MNLERGESGQHLNNKKWKLVEDGRKYNLIVIAIITFNQKRNAS